MATSRLFRVGCTYLILLFLTVPVSLNYPSPVHAQDQISWELVPYIWLPGIDADITAGGREADVDIDSDDFFDTVDFTGSLLSVMQFNRFILWTQADYFKLDADGVGNGSFGLESDVLFLTAAAGYRFNTFGKESVLDLLGGVRYLGMDNELGGRGGDEQEFVDGVVVIRPKFQLLDWLALNPTFSLGAGDSEVTYEMQPQLQILIGDALVARIGYRRLYYEIEGDRDNKFDGSFQGLIAGLGFML